MEKIRKDDTGDWFEMNRPQKSPRRRKFSVQKYKDEDEQEANDGDSDDGKDFYVQEEKRLGGRTSPLDLEHLIAQHEARMQYINQLDHNHKAMNNIGWKEISYCDLRSNLQNADEVYVIARYLFFSICKRCM